MPQLRLDRTGDVFVLTFQNADASNMLDDSTLDEFNAHLDTVEAASGNVALLITADDEKFFSNGINLDYIQSQGGMPFLLNTFVPRLDQLLQRLARFGCPTLAAINGHAFGGGALIASACDFRTMRADRGFLCFPEVDLGLALSPTMVACVNNLPSEAVRRRLALTGARIGGEEAARLGLVEAAHAPDALQPASLAMAAELAKKNRRAYATIKRSLLGPRWDALLAD